MEKGFDIYKRGPVIDNKLAKLRKSKTISEENKRNIEEFIEYKVGSKGIGKERQFKYLYIMMNVAKWMNKDFSKVGRKDIDHLLSENIEKSGFAAWTKSNYKQSVKQFFKWMGKPELVNDVFCGVKRNDIKTHILLTEKEAFDIIQATEHPRDRALLSFTWDSGARIGEILNMRVKDVLLLDDGAIKPELNGKTGPRNPKMWFCATYMRDWIRKHPYRNNPEAPLWIHIGSRSKQRDSISYNTIWKLFMNLARNAGIKGKEIAPHSWRRARATDLAQKGWSEAQLQRYLGWEFGSDMARVYISKAGVNTDSKMDEMYGVLPEKPEVKEQLKPIRCPRCKELSRPGDPFCGKCLMPFSQEGSIKLWEAIKIGAEIQSREIKRRK